MEIKGSRELQEDIARLEGQRNQAIEAERREDEAELERQKQAEAQKRIAEAQATKQRIAQAEAKREQDVIAEQEWWRKRREECFQLARNPLYASWNLCEYFVSTISGDGNEVQPCSWCHQCQAGWLNPHFKVGYYHKLKAASPR